MTTNTKKSVEKVKKYTSKSLEDFVELTHDVFLAGLGGFSIAREEVEKLSKRMIERGQITEKEGKKFVKEFLEKAKKGKLTLEEKIDDGIKKTFPKFEIPTKDKIQTLNEKIETLNSKVEGILKKKVDKTTGKSKTKEEPEEVK
jgi:poly(hydroxyalkanoate) granule-associated protein